ncbi:MAG: hypothetical protein VKP62_14195, partial [Candidatus Sericytochromatia bacterium]|nr:hypothetical protein [Candidatus Sericytochromatia bacterium]
MVREPQLRNQTSVWRFWVTLCLVTANLVLAGCAGWMPASVGFPTGDGLANLAEPRGIDWSTHRIGMRGLGDRQQAFVEAQAARLALNPPPPAPVAAPNSLYELQANWPASTTDWDYAGAKGIPVASLAVGADDVPNGLATAIAADSGKRIYALSRNGNFIKTNVTTPKVSNDSIPLNDTFTNSAITLSPAGKRAYVVSDSGTLYVIQTDNFGATVQSMNLPDSATAKGLAPILDPGSSSHDDMFDTLFVPANNGKVYRYEYSGSSLTYKQTYDLASSATPLTGCTG